MFFDCKRVKIKGYLTPPLLGFISWPSISREVLGRESAWYRGVPVRLIIYFLIKCSTTASESRQKPGRYSRKCLQEGNPTLHYTRSTYSNLNFSNRAFFLTVFTDGSIPILVDWMQKNYSLSEVSMAAISFVPVKAIQAILPYQ